MPAGAAAWQKVGTDGKRSDFQVTSDEVFAAAKAAARQWSEGAGVVLGGDPQIHEFDPNVAKAMIAKAK